jgi:hypothetical protein
MSSDADDTAYETVERLNAVQACLNWSRSWLGHDDDEITPLVTRKAG